jgi:hypothetical protein
MDPAPKRPRVGPPGLWQETLWSIGLIGAVVVVLVLVAQLGRV